MKVMVERKVLSIITALLFPFALFAQQPDTLIKKLDSLSVKTDSAGGQVNNTNPAVYNEHTQITFSTYFILLGSNIKQQFTKPFHMTSKDWGKLGKFVLLTGALALADEPIQRGAMRFKNSSQTVRSISKGVTNFGGLYETYTLAALGAYGFIFKNEKMKTTTLLASQAYITGGLTESVLKFLSGRLRPSYYEGGEIEVDPTFHGPFYKSSQSPSGKKINSSFPSGHTTVAFAAATVYAMEYKDKPLVPILAYSAASLIGLSRITENKHWATDVLVGAALGYLTGRQVVNNYHRYAKIKAPSIKKNTVSFNLNYQHGVIISGLVYRFR